MKKSVRIAAILLLLAVALFIPVSLFVNRQNRMLMETVQMQTLTVIIADELLYYLRAHGSYPPNLSSLNLDQDPNYTTIAKEPFDPTLFDYTSDGRTFHLKARKALAGQGFTGDAQGGLTPVHPK